MLLIAVGTGIHICCLCFGEVVYRCINLHAYCIQKVNLIKANAVACNKSKVQLPLMSPISGNVPKYA